MNGIKTIFEINNYLYVFIGIAIGSGKPGYNVPIGCIVSLTLRKSCNNLYLPDFFLIMKIGEFHGELDGSICPAWSCSCTSSLAANNFSLVKGHWSTHMGLSLFQSILSACGTGLSMALFRKNLCLFCLFLLETLLA